MENIAEKVGSFVGGKIVDAVAVASAVVVLRKGVTDPKLIAGAFAVYASAKKEQKNRGQGLTFNFFCTKKNRGQGLTFNFFCTNSVSKVPYLRKSLNSRI